MKNIQELLDNASLHNPERIPLACGHSIPNTGGLFIFDYYDMRPFTTKVATLPDIDTSGLFPNGATYWMGAVDGSRACCMACGIKQYPSLFGS